MNTNSTPRILPKLSAHQCEISACFLIKRLIAASIMILIITIYGFGESDLLDLEKRVKGALELVTKIGTEEGHSQNSIEQIKRILQKKEQVDFKGQTTTIDNTYLYLLLDLYAVGDESTRTSSLNQIYDKLNALNKCLLDAKNLDYGERVKRASRYLYELSFIKKADEAQSKTGPSLNPIAEEIKQRCFGCLKLSLPKSEQVEFKGQSVNVDNTWLYSMLDSYAGEEKFERRQEILEELKSQVVALDERLSNHTDQSAIPHLDVKPPVSNSILRIIAILISVCLVLGILLLISSSDAWKQFRRSRDANRSIPFVPEYVNVDVSILRHKVKYECPSLCVSCGKTITAGSRKAIKIKDKMAYGTLESGTFTELRLSMSLPICPDCKSRRHKPKRPHPWLQHTWDKNIFIENVHREFAKAFIETNKDLSFRVFL